VNIMKLVSALIGIAALGGVALFSVAPASAMPAGVGATASETPFVQQTAYICNEWGHCWHQHNFGSGYYHPHYYGGWGDGGWHHWHHAYYGGGWGYGGWHHWHHWNQW
jgi:hypothetical protein